MILVYQVYYIIAILQNKQNNITFYRKFYKICKTFYNHDR